MSDSDLEVPLLLFHMQINKFEVDYPRRRKSQASKNIFLYPPRIELQINQKTDKASDLNFTLEVCGTKENVILEVSAPLSHAEHVADLGEGINLQGLPLHVQFGCFVLP